MKNTIKLLSLLAMIAILSCQKESKQNNQNIASSEQLIEQLATLYNSGAPSFYGEAELTNGCLAGYGNYLSGFFENEDSQTPSLYSEFNSSVYPSDGVYQLSQRIANECLNAIKKADQIINYTQTDKNISTEQKHQILAQSYFFRAFNYLYLAKNLQSEGLISQIQSQTNKGICSLSDIYELIEGDLTLSISLLNDNPEDKTKVSKTSAKTLLLDVYMSQSGYPLQADKYAEAALLAREIIKSGTSTLTPINSLSYNSLTSPTNSELIFAYKPKNDFSKLCLSKNSSTWGIVKGSTSNIYKPTKVFLSFYEQGKDLRIDEKQFFHSFFKFEKNGRTIIQTFDKTPYLWYDSDVILNGYRSNKLVVIYRYAEVLLYAAEAIAQSEGVSNQAVSYLSAIRSRAYHKTSSQDIEAKLKALSKDEFLEEIWLERLREFPLEMKLWDDIKRTGKYPVGLGQKIVFNNIIGLKNPIGFTYSTENITLPLVKK